jgi:hypothetical protein
MEVRTRRENSELLLDLENIMLRENIMPIDVKLSPVVAEPQGGVSKD